MEQSKERPVFTEHPPMTKILRAGATKFPVLEQAQPESAKKSYDAFHDNTDDTVQKVYGGLLCAVGCGKKHGTAYGTV